MSEPNNPSSMERVSRSIAEQDSLLRDLPWPTSVITEDLDNMNEGIRKGNTLFRVIADSIYQDYEWFTDDLIGSIPDEWDDDEATFVDTYLRRALKYYVRPAQSVLAAEEFLRGRLTPEFLEETINRTSMDVMAADLSEGLSWFTSTVLRPVFGGQEIIGGIPMDQFKAELEDMRLRAEGELFAEGVHWDARAGMLGEQLMQGKTPLEVVDLVTDSDIQLWEDAESFMARFAQGIVEHYGTSSVEDMLTFIPRFHKVALDRGRKRFHQLYNIMQGRDIEDSIVLEEPINYFDQPLTVREGILHGIVEHMHNTIIMIRTFGELDRKTKGL